MASCVDMPEDLVFQILLWLPVISLLRFKSVCKSWCALIENSTFVNQHLLRNRSNTNLILKDYDQFLMLSGHKFEATVPIDFHWYNNSAYEVTIINSINGIVCLHHDNGDVDLWNPATKQLRRLPESPIPRVEGSELIHHRNESHPVLGFDVKTGDYKVVRLILYTHGVDMPNSQVEVYSLSSNSWKVIHEDIILPVKTITTSPTPICWNGMCFWVGSRSDQELYEFLLSFDLGAEVFGTVPGPVPCDSADYISGLGFLNNKIALSRAVGVDPDIYHPRHTHFEVWVLNEYGMKESWTKLYTIERGIHKMCEIGFLRDGEILMDILDAEVDARKFFLYSITQEITHPLLASEGCFGMDHVLYNESIVSI